MCLFIEEPDNFRLLIDIDSSANKIITIRVFVTLYKIEHFLGYLKFEVGIPKSMRKIPNHEGVTIPCFREILQHRLKIL